MIRKELIDVGEMKALCHLIKEVFPSSLPREDLRKVMGYVRQVAASYDLDLHPPPVSQDLKLLVTQLTRLYSVPVQPVLM